MFKCVRAIGFIALGIFGYLHFKTLDYVYSPITIALIIIILAFAIFDMIYLYMNCGHFADFFENNNSDKNIVRIKE